MEQFNYRQEEEFGVTYNEYGKEYLGNQSSNISGEDQQLISHIKNNESNESNESNEDVKLKRTSTRNSVVPPPGKVCFCFYIYYCIFLFFEKYIRIKFIKLISMEI